MPQAYTGNASNVVPGSKFGISEPIDGDAGNAASMQTPEQAAADQREWLYERIIAAKVCNWTKPAISTNAFNRARWVPFLKLWVVTPNIGGGSIYTSPDGQTWTAQTSNIGASNLGQDEADNGATAVVVGGNPGGTAAAIVTSTNGSTWTSQTATATKVLNGVAYASTLALWAAVGGVAADTTPQVVTSSNATAWTAQTGPASTGRGHCIAAAPSLFMAGLNNASTPMMYSTNGTTWTGFTPTGMSNPVMAIAYASGPALWVAYDNGGNLWTAPKIGRAHV